MLTICECPQKCVAFIPVIKAYRITFILNPWLLLCLHHSKAMLLPNKFLLLFVFCFVNLIFGVFMMCEFKVQIFKNPLHIFVSIHVCMNLQVCSSHRTQGVTSLLPYVSWDQLHVRNHVYLTELFCWP